MTPVVANHCRPAWPLLLCAALLFALPPAVRAQDDDPLAEEDADESGAASEDASETDEESPAPEAEPETEAEAPSEGGEAAEPADGIVFHVAAGLGAGSLSFKRPTQAGRQTLPQTPFAAADLVMRLRAWPQDSVSLELQLAYQTSLGLVVQHDPQFALPEDVHVRAQRVELTAAPALHLGDGPRAPVLAFPLGFVFRAFVPEVDYLLVSEYSLGGPELRVELWLALGKYIQLRLGPELQWLVLVDDALRREDVNGSGLALGGQGTLEGRIGPIFRVALVYRESRTTVAGTRSDFSDVERFLTVRVGGEM